MFARSLMIALMSCSIAVAPTLSGALAQTAPDTTEVTPIQWDSRASKFLGDPGQEYVFSCPGQGTAERVWGNDIYTDDSSICTAAVHAGKITFARGGVVRIRIRPGRAIYGSTARHGVQSEDYGTWGRSFTFVNGHDAAPTPPADATDVSAVVPIGWDSRPPAAEAGTRFTLRCPPNGNPGRIWGTDVYTDDSPVCTAAVHAGKITASRGGVVTIVIRPGLPEYASSVRHGIASTGYHAWSRSYAFVSGAIDAGR
ncbi:MAG: hypothetical protein NVSMB64_03840 [Candidatus Velthaea sp.]